MKPQLLSTRLRCGCVFDETGGVRLRACAGHQLGNVHVVERPMQRGKHLTPETQRRDWSVIAWRIGILVAVAAFWVFVLRRVFG